jgi:hypothetical protein
MMNQDGARRSEVVQSSRRPPAVTLLALAFVWAALSGWARLYLAVRDWPLLAELGVAGGPLYLALGGVLWGLLGLPAAVGLWTGKRWAPITARLAAVILFLSFWFDRLLSAWIGTPPPNWIFALVVSVLAMVYTFATLALPASRGFFNR